MSNSAGGADLNGIGADLTDDSPSGSNLEIGYRRERQAISRADDAAANRMRRPMLECGSQRQNLVAVQAIDRIDRDYLRPAMGQRAGLVEADLPDRRPAPPARCRL